MLRRRKGITGDPGLMFFALVVAITIGVVYLLNLIPLVNNIVGIKAEARFQTSQDDSGTALAAFLASDMGKGSYAEILGEQAADGVSQDLDKELRATLGKMSPNGRVAVYYGNDLKKDYNGVSGDYLRADLALPGIKKGEVRVT